MRKRSSDGILSIINNVLGITTLLLPLIPTAISFFLKWPLWAVIATFVVFCIVAIVFWKGKACRKLRIRMLEKIHRSLSPKEDYKYVEREAIYTYSNRETMSLSVHFSVKILRGSHDFLDGKIKWSAGSVASVQSVVPGQSIQFVSELNKTDVLDLLGFEYFNINLGKTYTDEDEPFESGFETAPLYDPDHKARSCFVSTVEHKTDLLILRVRFPGTLKVTNIRKLKYGHLLDKEHYDAEDGELEGENGSGFNCVTFRIENPIKGGKYAIDWDFEDESSN